MCVVRDAKRNNNAHAHLGSVNANPVHVDANVASNVPPRNCVLLCPHTSDYDRLYKINSMQFHHTEIDNQCLIFFISYSFSRRNLK